jgi:hypothetical protein
VAVAKVTRAPRKKDYSKFIEDLRGSERLEFLNLGHRHLVFLAEKIANFDSPFEYLKTVRGGFDPQIRYLLDQCLAGDAVACSLRDSMVLLHKRWFTPEPNVPGHQELWTQFFTQHQAACQNFIETNYPWRRFNPREYDERRFQRDPRLDEYFTAAVLDHLGAFGFRRLARSFKSDVLERPMQIKWDKGTWSLSMAVWLQVPTLAQNETIAFPFCFSGGGFDHSLASNVERQLQLFFSEYGKIFPDVLAAVEQSIKEQEAWLAAYHT